MIKKLLNRFTSSEFLRNVATLGTGTTIAQIIAIGTAPIVYRLYNEDNYGTLGLYMAIAGVLGVFSTMQYTQTVLLEKEDEQSKVAMWLNRYINVAFSLLVLVAVLILKNYVGGWTNNPNISPWLILLPVSIFFSGQNEIFRVWANRKKEYKLMTLNSIIVALSVPAFSITLGLIKREDPLGLFVGLLASQILPAVILLIGLNRRYDLGPKGISISAIREHARRNEKFPLYSLPSEFINRLTNQLPVFMLSIYTGASTVGIYNLAVRMLGLPSTLISNAISEVFRQRATKDYNATGNCRPIFLKTFKSLSALSIIPVLVITFWGPDLFAFVFGENWRMAGVFARVLMIMYAAKLVVSPLSYMFYIVKRLEEDFYWHIWMLVSNAALFLIAFELSMEPVNVLLIFALNYLVIYMIYGIRCFNFTVHREAI